MPFPLKPDIAEIGAVVYVFRAGDTNRYKIGRAANVEVRRKQLQTGCPDRLELVGIIEGDAVRIESEFHRMFAEQRVSGEWFEFEDPSQIRRFFRPNAEADSRALEFLLLSITEIRASVESTIVYDNQSFIPVLRFQVVPKRSFFEHPFLEHYRTERTQQLHESPIIAVADFIDAFNIWPGRTEWLKKIGETYYVRDKSAKNGFGCPNCSWPIIVKP